MRLFVILAIVLIVFISGCTKFAEVNTSENKTQPSNGTGAQASGGSLEGTVLPPEGMPPALPE